VSAATATTLIVAGFPTPTTAGTSQSFTVTAQDAFGNTATGYTGTVALTSNDPLATFSPASYHFTAGDQGVHSFSGTLRTAGLNQSVTATDSATATITGTETGIQVNVAAANSLTLSGFPTPTVAGVQHSFTVTARDQFGNIATGYAGTVVLTSSDPQASFATTSYTFNPAIDAGSHTFNATLKTAGTQTLVALDLANGLIATEAGGVTVTPAAASQLVFTTGTQTLTAGVNSGTITVQEQDQFGNATTTAETVNLSTSNSGTGLFKDNATGLTTITSVTIPAGSSTASFKYVDTLASSPTLTAAATGLTSATQTETVVPAVKPTVTIDQQLSQADPTNVASVAFDVQFSKPVAGFDETDVSFAGSTAGGSLIAAVTGSGRDYVVTVTGMTSQGTVVASIPADSAQDADGNDNLASTSTDNAVLFDNVPPTVTINQSGVIDPTNTTVSFNVHFSEPVTGFDETDVSFAGTTGGLTPTASITGSGQDYVVTASGMHGVGTIVASIPAGAAQDAAGNDSTASTSTDNSVGFDDVNPTVTINQGSGQVDPTSIASVVFDIHFSKPMSGFTPSDVVLTGTAGGSLVKALSGSGADYTLTVTGITSPGTVIANIPANVAQDVAGNGNQASTSTDNSVLFDTIGSLQFSAPTFTVAENGVNATISVTRTGGSANAVSVQFATVTGGTATDGADYTSTSGTLNWANGDTATKTFTVLVSDDNQFESTETVNLALSTPTGGAVLGSQSTAVLDITDYEEGTFTFSLQNYSGSEGGTVGIVVQRSSGSDGPVDIDLISALGNAEASDIAFAIGTTTVHFNDGETTRTINIPINNDPLSEGFETVNFSLSNASKGIIPLGTSTVLTINPSNPIIFYSTNKFPQKFLDVDQDVITVNTVAVPVLNVYGTDEALPLAAGNVLHAPISLLELVGTVPLKSSLSVAVAKAPKTLANPNPTGDGIATIGGITGSGLKSVSASKVTLDGDFGPGLNFNSYVGTIRLGDVINGADIVTTNIGAGPKSKVKVTLGVVGDGTDITIPTPLSTFSATSFGDGTITVPSATSITMKGRRANATIADPGDPGNFGGDIVMSGALAPAATLGTLKVAGSLLATSSIDVNGKLTTAVIGTANGVVDEFQGDLSAGSIATFIVNGKMSGDLTLSGAVPVGTNPVGPTLKTLKVTDSVSAASAIVVNGSSVAAPGKINSVTVGTATKSNFFHGSLTADLVGTFTVNGDMSGDVTVRGPGIPNPTTVVLTSFKVKGNVLDSEIKVNGNVGTVSALTFKDSLFFAGYDGLTDGSTVGGFSTAATVNSFKVTGVKGGVDEFANSYVIATNFKNVTLHSVDKTNGGTPIGIQAPQFGIVADGKVTTLKIGTAVFYTATADPGNLGKVDGDFAVKIV